jgi:hypothetical protein
MLKTMPALSLGFLLAGTAASNAGQPSRTLVHKLHAHRAAHYRTVGLRAREGAPVIGSDLKMGFPLGATSLVPETDAADPLGANKGCLWGRTDTTASLAHRPDRRSTWRRGESRKPHARQRVPRGNLGRDLPELPRSARGLPSQAPTAKKDKQFIVSALQRGSSHKSERGQLSERTASESMGLVLDDHGLLRLFRRA